MEIKLEERSRIDILHITGRLDLVSSSALKDRLHQRLQDGRMEYVLECGGLDFINSSGLGRLISMYKDVRLAGGRMVFCSVTPFVDEVIRLTDLHKVFEIFESVDEASESFKAWKPNNRQTAPA